MTAETPTADDLRGADLEGAKWDETTTWPEGWPR